MPNAKMAARLAEEPEFEIGLNYAWPDNKYGIWIGPQDTNVLLPEPWWATTVERNLRLYKEHGVSLIRFFILATLANYGRDIPTRRPVPSFAAAKAGQKIEEVVDWDWEQPTIADPRYGEHFGLLLNICRRVGVRIIPCLLNYALGYYIRRRILTQTTSLELFGRTLLADLAVAAEPYRDIIFAWDIINEPYWCSSVIDPEHFTLNTQFTLNTKVIPWPQISADISLLLGAMEKLSSGIPTTVGHRYGTDLTDGKLPLGDVHQYHYYPRAFMSVAMPDPKVLPTANPNEFMILGEADIAAGPPLARTDGWPELDRKDLTPGQTVRERCRHCRNKKYRKILFWPDTTEREKTGVADGRPTDPPKYSSAQLAEIRTYVQTL